MDTSVDTSEQLPLIKLPFRIGPFYLLTKHSAGVVSRRFSLRPWNHSILAGLIKPNRGSLG